MIVGWKYYNHAAVPTSAPHNDVNIAPIVDGSVWSGFSEGTPLLARWTTDFDCGYERQWWYIIKDTPFDINALKSKRRYEINKGKKNFTTKVITPCHMVDELFLITIEAYSSWPKKYRPTVSLDSFKREIDTWKNHTVIGAFDNETKALCGYALLWETNEYVDFKSLRVIPQEEKRGINAALVAGILEYYEKRLCGGYYICDGSRSVRHETAFQEYLEKYFGFRKAYCNLRIAYSPKMKIAVSLLYPFRKLIKQTGKIGSMVSGILRMEEISRSCRGE